MADNFQEKAGPLSSSYVEHILFQVIEIIISGILNVLLELLSSFAIRVDRETSIDNAIERRKIYEIGRGNNLNAFLLRSQVSVDEWCNMW